MMQNARYIIEIFKSNSIKSYSIMHSVTNQMKKKRKLMLKYIDNINFTCYTKLTYQSLYKMLKLKIDLHYIFVNSTIAYGYTIQ